MFAAATYSINAYNHGITEQYCMDNSSLFPAKGTVHIYIKYHIAMEHWQGASAITVTLPNIQKGQLDSVSIFKPFK